MRFKSSSILKHPYQEIDFLHLYLVKHTFNLQCTKGFTFVFLQNVLSGEYCSDFCTFYYVCVSTYMNLVRTW